MPFPTVDRVIYNKKPLDTVICQARFPTILRIDTEIPSAFQEKLLPEYINLTEGQEVVVDIRLGNKPVVPTEDIKQITAPAIKNYEFASEDNKWKVNLTRTFISLSTTDYHIWEEFKTRFASVLDAFIDVYKPVLFTRIGLRYIDVIVRSKLDLDNIDWEELIKPPFLGILASPELKDSVKHFQSTSIIDLENDQGVARVNAGTVKSTESAETSFMIDSDFYELKRKEKEELLNKLDSFHSMASGLFRMCITDRLHNAMEPKQIS